MVRLETLNELSRLRETEFGQPYPRHGLALLWWFADKRVEIDDDGNMIAQGCDPEHKDYGFHLFHNKEGILPDSDLPYYEVGNLRYDVCNQHPPGKLPRLVTKNYDPDEPESNADRIVVSVDSDCNDKRFDRIYVTHHLGKGLFDVNSTYRISQGLIRKIKSMEWSDFIREVKI